MKFWDSGYTPSEANSHLRNVYGISDYVTRVENVFRVKRGVFSWSVVNLSLFPDPNNKSPVSVFCHSPSHHLLDTSWCLQLCPKATVNGQRGLSLRLLRDADDPGPEKVLASYRLGVGKSDNSVWFEAKESTFWKGNFVQLNTSVLGYLEDFFSDGVDGAHVVCEVYVSYYPAMSKETAWAMSHVDKSLPEDMSALLNSSHSMDALIEIRGHQIRSHECVLFARSKTLCNRLKKDGNFSRPSYSSLPAMLQLSCSLLCLKCVLSYMYTGSFDYLARNAYFSIGLYEVADELSLFPLRDLFHPDKKSNKSLIHADRIEEVLKEEFSVRSFFSNTTYRIQGKLCKTFGLLMSLLVYKIGQLPNYFVGFKLEISGISGGFHGEASLSLLDLYGRSVEARLLSHEMSSEGSKLTAIFVLSAAEFVCCDVVGGFISVRVAYKIYKMRHDHIRILDPGETPSKPLEPWCWREQLAQDLKTLLQNGHSSDILMMVEGRSFKVYRSILAARSPYFHSLFYENDVVSSAVYRIDDVKPRTFWLMLNYAYCGTLNHFNDLSIRDFMELFRVSANYGLSSLVGISYIFMKMVVRKLNLIDF